MLQCLYILLWTLVDTLLGGLLLVSPVCPCVHVVCVCVCVCVRTCFVGVGGGGGVVDICGQSMDTVVVGIAVDRCLLPSWLYSIVIILLCLFRLRL